MKGIIIEGVEMPKKCTDCPCFAKGNTMHMCRATKTVFEDGIPEEMPDNCPVWDAEIFDDEEETVNFQTQVSISDCHDCTFNIYPSQTHFIDNSTEAEK